MAIDLSISADYLPADRVLISSRIGTIAVYAAHTDNISYPVRYHSALLNQEGRVIDQYYGSESAWGAVAQLYFAHRPYRSDINKDLALLSQLKEQAQRDCADLDFGAAQ